MPLSELIIGVTALLQGMLLVFPRTPSSRRGAELLSVLGLGAAALYLAATLKLPSLPLSFEMLEDQALFRAPRAALLLSAVLLSRVVASTRELPGSRKPEVLFLVTLLALLCDLLILSRHAALSVILLVLASWVGLFLGGLAYRGRREGEAVLKFWTQASLSLTVGFGAIVLLSLVAGGAHFTVIGEFVKAQAPYSPQALLVVAALFLPFFMAGGFFPFHFISIDRDHGLPWAVQTVLSVTFQGAVAVAAWKMGVTVFGHAGREGVSEGMRVLQLCGLIGGFWLAVFALSQDNSKRLYSALVGAQWSAVLVAGALPTLLSATAVVYALSATFVWSAALGFVWSRFQEWAGDERIASVYGAAKSFRASGLILLIALASPLFVPGFPGFPSVLYLLAAMIEQKSLIYLATEAGLLSLLCLICIRIGTDLLFRERSPQTLGRGQTLGKEAESFLSYGALDWSVLGGTAAILLSTGFFWHSVLHDLERVAQLFLQ
jgi:NADH:ubiquinone oxidoreductase subunit 2 (subunit N)